MHSIIQYTDPKKGKVLREKSKPIKEINNEIILLFKDLESLAKAGSKEGITLVGLSAPQLGENLQAFIYYDFKTDAYVPVINPKVTYESKELSSEWEGCASIGEGPTSLFGPVSRAKSCKIEFLGIDNTLHCATVSNYMSHIVLHEMDHLNGILFLDRVKDEKMIFTAKELDAYAKNHNGKYPKV
jgi:peptide deformylase